MGYILPIETYQYNDYQNRISTERRKVSSIDSPFKVVLEKKHQEFANQFARTSRSTYQTPEQIISDEILTGKGRYFSGWV
ncbi:hypothetical protein CWR48_11940 [Oceanobacillus arenosus]|uniref:Uncharacterized protein n=1 Tax=Oceanobacillus arenosus TaxID=1229153 RepID=A0A3D8PSR5_9BACI|nr:hypothetical protein [Oceanobacillus arenosus]RDW18288.1 hypothetical protein CWR48_11940 [Oceanobacillus arenosus]